MPKANASAELAKGHVAVAAELKKRRLWLERQTKIDLENEQKQLELELNRKCKVLELGLGLMEID